MGMLAGVQASLVKWLSCILAARQVVTQVHSKANDKSLLCLALSELPMNSCNLEDSIRVWQATTKVWKSPGKGMTEKGECSLTLFLKCHRAARSPKPRYHNLNLYRVKWDFWESGESSVAILKQAGTHTHTPNSVLNFRGLKPIHRVSGPGQESQLKI